MLLIYSTYCRKSKNTWIFSNAASKLVADFKFQIWNIFNRVHLKRLINVGPRLSTLLTCMENKNPFLLDSTQYLMLDSYLFQNNENDVIDEIKKFDKFYFMEYGLKVGHNFDQRCKKLHESGWEVGLCCKATGLFNDDVCPFDRKPFYFCVGSANWNSLFGCPDGCLLNLFHALNNINSNKPNGLLLCEFVGALTRTPFAFNLNSIMMFAGPAWNNNIEIVNRFLLWQWFD